MSSERWRRVEGIYHAALSRPFPERSAFVTAACAGDDDLRREVESLLAQTGAFSDHVLGEPTLSVGAVRADDASSTSLIGEQVGHYHVLGRLGAGGMGEVYRARDTKLRRDVAIKILPPAFTSDAERLARFRREAHVLASLNHPHIAAIYGLEDTGGVHALVLELVDGQTLADRIRHGPLSPKEALTIARQLVVALDAAHEKGVVHRDLKPANIQITSEGAVKVLDFGLAKAASAAADETQELTGTVGGTRDGVILGTAAYMSPEQARGLKIDKRTDIWAFGCVLYEMLTGRVAFAGQTFSDTIAAILQREPDWTVLPAGTPPSVRRLLQRSLEKDLKRRLRDIGDAQLELEDAPNDAAVPDPREPRLLSQPWIWGLASVLIVLGLGLGLTLADLRRPAPEIRAATLAVNPPPGVELRVAGEGGGSAISPDGRLLAYVARQSNGVSRLWVQPLNSRSARELPGTEDARYPFWSPDSASLGFFAGGKLRRVDIAGGLPAPICDVAAGRGGTWNAEGVILFNAVNDGPLLKVSAAGGLPEPFTTVDTANGENSHRFPQFLPGGRQFLYFNRGKNSGIYLGSLDRRGDKVRLLNSPTNAVYAADGEDEQSGHLFWVRDGTLVAQQFNTRTYSVTGQPVIVAEGVALGASGQSTVSVANDGTILYSEAGNENRQLIWYGRDGNSLGFLGQQERYRGLRISPDAKRVAFTRGRDVWQMDFARAIPTRVTFGGGNNPVWSPDGQSIAYQKGAPPNLFIQNTSGTGSEERLIESRDTLILQDWSPDGKFLLYNVMSNDISLRAQSDPWLLPLTGDRKPFRFRTNEFREGPSQFSPDGKWIAYTSDELGANEIFVQSFPAGAVKLRASTSGGAWPRWRRDSKELFYLARDGKLMSVKVRPVSGSLELETPSSLFAMPALRGGDGDNDPYRYDVMPDGDRFLATIPASPDESPSLAVVLNWKASLAGDKR